MTLRRKHTKTLRESKKGKRKERTNYKMTDCFIVSRSSQRKEDRIENIGIKQIQKFIYLGSRRQINATHRSEDASMPYKKLCKVSEYSLKTGVLKGGEVEKNIEQLVFV